MEQLLPWAKLHVCLWPEKQASPRAGKVSCCWACIWLPKTVLGRSTVPVRGLAAAVGCHRGGHQLSGVGMMASRGSRLAEGLWMMGMKQGTRC